MNTSQIYIAVTIAVLGVIALLFFFVIRNRKERKLTPLSGLAFGFILLGLFIGDNRFIGYGLMGVGVILAVIDMVQKLRGKPLG